MGSHWGSSLSPRTRHWRPGQRRPRTKPRCRPTGFRPTRQCCTESQTPRGSAPMPSRAAAQGCPWQAGFGNPRLRGSTCGQLPHPGSKSCWSRMAAFATREGTQPAGWHSAAGRGTPRRRREECAWSRRKKEKHHNECIAGRTNSASGESETAGTVWRVACGLCWHHPSDGANLGG